MNEKTMNMKEDIRRISGKIIKISKVCKILCFIGAIGSFIGFISCAVMAFLNVGSDFIEQHPELIAKMGRYDYNNFQKLFVDGQYQISTRSLYLYAMGECFVAIVMLILVILMLHFLSKVFQTISNSETPFTEAVLGDLKVMMVLIVILCLQSNWVLGLIIGFVMVCLYKIFRYGCMLQQESDETL